MHLRRWLTATALALPLACMGGCDDKAKDKDKSGEEDGTSGKKKKKKDYTKFHKEAVDAVGAMSRGATFAYEREQEVAEGEDSNALCKSAESVPSDIPDVKKGYKPKDDDGKDFNAGDSTTGWKCLKFAMTSKLHCQYSYVAGGPFKSTKRGNKDISDDAGKKDGKAMIYEVSAECDFDGDGETSLYASTGTIDPKTKRLKRAKKLFIDKEGE